MQFEVENSEWLKLSCKVRTKRWSKKSQRSSFLWKQLYSSSGLKAARTACNATREKIYFNIISMPIYVHTKWVSFYSFCPVFSGQVLQVVPLLYQQVKWSWMLGSRFYPAESEVICAIDFTPLETVTVWASEFPLFIHFKITAATMASPNLISNYAWTKLSACLPRDVAGAWHNPGMSGQWSGSRWIHPCVWDCDSFKQSGASLWKFSGKEGGVNVTELYIFDQSYTLL